MVAFDSLHQPVDIPISGSDQVADVTGAGDTVIAGLHRPRWPPLRPRRKPRNWLITLAEWWS